METVWIHHPSHADLLILVGDIGGTHTSLGIVGKTGRSYSLLVKFLFKTKELESIFSALTQVKSVLAEHPELNPIKLCCFSVAGPVQDNRCRMTNVHWHIQGVEIEAFLDVRTLIVNDFLALSYALPLLDPAETGGIQQLHLPKGPSPTPSGFLRAVIGAGTGLGVGFLMEDHGKYIAIPSEGGHVDWTGLDAEHRDLYDCILQTVGVRPEAEHLISGPGIGRIYRYLKEKDSRLASESSTLHASPDINDLPNWVALNADHDPICQATMEIFVKAYARFAYNTALTFLPSSGLYLAGGIVTKNIKVFEKDHLFYRNFLATNRSAHRSLLEKIPIYIVTDYSVSLLGAAHAAYSLL